MKRLILIIVIVFLMIKLLHADDKIISLQCSVYFPVDGSVLSPEIDKELKDIYFKYVSNGIVAINLRFNMRTKDSVKRCLLRYLEQKLKVGEITKEEMEKKIKDGLKAIPDSVTLFDDNINFTKILKVYLIYPDGKKKNITDEMKMLPTESYTIKPLKNKNTLFIDLLFKEESLLRNINEGDYKLEVIYDSRDVQSDKIWKGILKDEGYQLKKKLVIVHPRNKLQKLAGKMSLLRFYFTKGKEKQTIALGEKILSEEKGFYWCYYYLGKSYDKIGETDKAYKYYKKWLDSLDYLYKIGFFDKRSWEEYLLWYYGPVKDRIKKIEESKSDIE